ncbi:MAG: hypothetical protein ACYS67_05850 [Planctomycetota bacterium]|jgi:hypothetical protein
MAGYLFNLDKLQSLEMYIRRGIYSTKLSTPAGIWKRHHEATFADYATMKAGDNVYFFIDRKIYGIGELVDIESDCKFCNFPNASHPNDVDYTEIKNLLLWDEGEFSKNQRWLCTFKPSPHFFCNGIDMDDVLTSNPAAFRMLRAFWGLSFIKFDDVENQAFKDIILKSNKQNLENPVIGEDVFQTDYQQVHSDIGSKVTSGEYTLQVSPILSSCAEGNLLKHEMAIEAGILFQLSYSNAHTVDIFGEWDYLYHQVIASPFKPIDYMDKMDIFGYAYIGGFDPTKSKFLVVENKKGSAIPSDIEQLLKYVDWQKDEYCFGDYSMIHAFLVASDFSREVVNHKNDVCSRKYTVGRRPARSLEWTNLQLVKYEFDPDSASLRFEIVN